MNVYFNALPHLETIKPKSAYGAKVLASEDDWCMASGHNRRTVHKALVDLAARGPISLTPGDNGRTTGKRKAAIVRRNSIAEIQTACPREVLTAFVPADAEQLCAILNERGIPWHGQTIKPRWTVQRTGRIGYGGSIMVQPGHNTKAARIEAFRASLRPGERLIEADFSSAEPSLLCHELEQNNLIPPGIDPAKIYSEIQRAAKSSRDDAKTRFQKTVYSPYPNLYVPEAWNLEQGHFLREVISGAERYRNRLWDQGKPTKDQPRHVHTATGRLIQGVSRERIHRGKVLAWRLQGTIADIFLSIIPAVLEAEQRGECRLFLPLHDALYVSVPEGSTFNPARLMQEKAAELGLPLKVTTKEHGQGGGQRRRPGGRRDRTGLE